MVEQMAQGRSTRSSGRPSRAEDDRLPWLATELLTRAVALACQLDDAQELNSVSRGCEIPDVVGRSGEYRAVNTVGDN
jgi:hypothetical protein